ncbi:unnamed protein product [Ilex paraguariensis]|uniref:ELMO domain-containing protein n=1 Tax=Ilex paraguariensis TaxID=185542 RepID=A0ABC8RQI4_9AQUA
MRPNFRLQDALKQLWRLAYPDRDLPPLKSELWKEMGWQGPDPSTDFRGGGFISLENLIFFAKMYPNTAVTLENHVVDIGGDIVTNGFHSGFILNLSLALPLVSDFGSRGALDADQKKEATCEQEIVAGSLLFFNQCGYQILCLGKRRHSRESEPLYRFLLDSMPSEGIIIVSDYLAQFLSSQACSSLLRFHYVPLFPLVLAQSSSELFQISHCSLLLHVCVCGFFGGHILTPEAFWSLLHKIDGNRAEWEYPFAVAGINISFMLVQMLDLQSGQPTSLAGIRFLEILNEDEMAFDNLYCIAFQMMDVQWLAKHASYMEFNDVLKSTRTQLERELALEDISSVKDLPAYNLLKR